MSEPPPNPTGPPAPPGAPSPPVERWNVASLRRARPIRARGNFGTGAPCPMCRMILSPNDLVFEAIAELDGQQVTINFHPRCYDRWRDSAGRP